MLGMQYRRLINRVYIDRKFVRIRSRCGEGDLRPDTVRVAGAGASDGVDFSFFSAKAEGWTGGLYEVVGYCKTT